tara:strand:- start:5949 stop:6410 length:462 start_codon:yes stop_codon:yes gene_type:complete
MAAILVAADLAEWATGLQFDGSSPVSTAQAAAMIRRAQTRFTSAVVVKGYSAANVEDSTHTLYDLAQDYTGNKAGAQCWLAFTRGAGRDLATDLREEAEKILEAIAVNPDAVAGADALAAGDGRANRPRSAKTRTTPHTYSSTLDQMRRTGKI